LTVPEALFLGESVPLLMHGWIQTRNIKQCPFCDRPFMSPTFWDTITYIGRSELSRTNVSGHIGRTGEVLDVGATLTECSDVFYLFFLPKNGCLNWMSQFPYNIE
jgi:hypothetical protein